MLANKWINFALSAVVAVMGFAATTDWTSLFSAKTAGGITMGVAVLKMVLNLLAPAAGATVAPTTSSLITHQAT